MYDVHVSKQPAEVAVVHEMNENELKCINKQQLNAF